MCKTPNLAPLQSLFLHPQPPLYIHYSPINSTLLLIIRIIAALYLTSFYLYDFSQSESALERFLFLTFEGYFFTWLYFVIVLQSRFVKVIRGLDQYAEIIFQVMLGVELHITVTYWIILYPSDKDTIPLFKNISWHGIPFFFLLLDFILGSHRFIWSQFTAYPVFAFWYFFCVNMTYSLAARPVYGSPDQWRSWMTYVLIVVCSVAAGLMFGLGRIIYSKCKEENVLRNNQDSEQSAPKMIKKASSDDFNKNSQARL